VGIGRGDTLAPDIAPNLDQPAVRVEVPTTFGDIKTRAPEVALSWRMASREVFQHYFALGYQAVDFVSARGAAIGSYMLQRRTGTRPVARKEHG